MFSIVFNKAVIPLASTLHIPKGYRPIHTIREDTCSKCSKIYLDWCSQVQNLFSNKLENTRGWNCSWALSLWTSQEKKNWQKQRNSINPFPFYLCLFAWKLIQAYWSWNSAALSPSQCLKCESRIQCFTLIFFFFWLQWAAIIFFVANFCSTQGTLVLIMYN